jgi:hypothetical protein
METKCAVYSDRKYSVGVTHNNDLVVYNGVRILLPKTKKVKTQRVRKSKYVGKVSELCHT